MRAAIYARFSTDKQRDASIEDQFRECDRVAKAAGLKVISRFEDRGISAGTATRSGYQALLAAARLRQFDIIVTEDISRLWRNRAEFGPRSAELEDLGVHCLTCVGDDTRRDGWGLVMQIKQAVAEHARREASYRTRRGQEGLARAGKTAGGRAYAYIPAALSKTGEVEIDKAQAAVVVRIFEWYASGMSPRAIAARLNARDTPSPGAAWHRSTRRRDGKWVSSAIHGHSKRGSGILNNRRYIGVVSWGRTEWTRSAADSSVRRVKVLKQARVEHTDERLRIVPQSLWDQVKARQAEVSRRIGEGVKRGLSQAAALRDGSGSRYLLSGLMRCAHCGSAFAINAKDRYGCSGHRSGGSSLCNNSALLRREVAEAEVLSGLKSQLRSPEVIAEIVRRVRAVLRRPKQQPPDASAARIAKLKAEVENLADAIASGALRSSPTLAARLASAEEELEGLSAAQPAAPRPKAEVIKLLADLPKLAERAVDHLEHTLGSGDVTRAREEIRSHVGTLRVEADAREFRLYSEQGVAAVLLRAVGGAHSTNVGSGGRI